MQHSGNAAPQCCELNLMLGKEYVNTILAKRYTPGRYMHSISRGILGFEV